MQTDTVELHDPHPIVESVDARLVAVTPEARAALGGRSTFQIPEFPFRVGREGRLTTLARLKDQVERRIGHKKPLNDLYLDEPPSGPLHISREHFVIQASQDRYVLSDRGSACGTIVGGNQVGADSPISAVIIRSGDVITVGSAASPYVFRFEASAAPFSSEDAD